MSETMICDNCGRAGIRWMGPLSNLTHTECPHCGGQNCQRAPLEAPECCQGTCETEEDCSYVPICRAVDELYRPKDATP